MFHCVETPIEKDTRAEYFTKKMEQCQWVLFFNDNSNANDVAKLSNKANITCHKTTQIAGKKKGPNIRWLQIFKPKVSGTTNPLWGPISFSTGQHKKTDASREEATENPFDI